MKIIRPEYPIKQEAKILQEPTIEKDENVLIGNNDVQPIDNGIMVDLMKEVLKENTRDITFTVTITKRQYEIWTKKGGEKWLKKALDGQTKSKSKSKSKKKKVR